jgi:hypothetical protein
MSPTIISRYETYIHFILAFVIFIVAISFLPKDIFAFIGSLSMRNILFNIDTSPIVIFNIPLNSFLSKIIIVSIFIIISIYIIDYIRIRGTWLYYSGQNNEKFFSLILQIPGIFLIFILPCVLSYYLKYVLPCPFELIISNPIVFLDSIFSNYGSLLEGLFVIFTLLMFIIYKVLPNICNRLIVNYTDLECLYKRDIQTNNLRLIINIQKHIFLLWAIIIDAMIIVLFFGFIFNFNLLSMIFIESGLLSWFAVISCIQNLPKNKCKLIGSNNPEKEYFVHFVSNDMVLVISSDSEFSLIKKDCINEYLCTSQNTNVEIQNSRIVACINRIFKIIFND